MITILRDSKTTRFWNRQLVWRDGNNDKGKSILLKWLRYYWKHNTVFAFEYFTRGQGKNNNE